jgi:hypothetical protein
MDRNTPRPIACQGLSFASCARSRSAERPTWAGTWNAGIDETSSVPPTTPAATATAPSARQQALQAAVLERTAEIEKAAAEVVKTEAQGQSWLQRTWRPITMLVFVALIVARSLGWSVRIQSRYYRGCWWIR